MTSRDPGMDPRWQSARARLRRAQDAVDDVLDAAGERVAGLLARRAADLARPAPRREQLEYLDIVTFELAGERFGIEARFVTEVSRIPAWTVVPGAPSILLGVTTIRGEILPVFDFHALLGAPRPQWQASARLLVIGAEQPDLGFLVEAVHHVEPVSTASIRRMSNPEQPGSRLPLRGVTPDALGVLDAQALLSDQRLIIGSAPDALQPGSTTP